jgi:hypothetical protein
MYEAHFYTPEDFTNSSSEQHLEIYRGAIEQGWSQSESLRYLLCNLHLEADLPQSREQRQLVLSRLAHYPEESEREQRVVHSLPLEKWMSGALHHLSLPRNKPSFDLSFVQHSWHKSGDLDEIYIGRGMGRWVVVHWYSTA